MSSIVLDARQESLMRLGMKRRCVSCSRLVKMLDTQEVTAGGIAIGVPAGQYVLWCPGCLLRVRWGLTRES